MGSAAFLFAWVRGSRYRGGGARNEFPPQTATNKGQVDKSWSSSLYARLSLIEADVECGQLVAEALPHVLAQGAQRVAAPDVQMRQLLEVHAHQLQVLRRHEGVLVQVEGDEAVRAQQDLGQARRGQLGPVQGQRAEALAAQRHGLGQSVVHVDAVHHAKLPQRAEAVGEDDEVGQLRLVQPGIVVAPCQRLELLQVSEGVAQQRGGDVGRDPNGEHLQQRAPAPESNASRQVRERLRIPG